MHTDISTGPAALNTHLPTSRVLHMYCTVHNTAGLDGEHSVSGPLQDSSNSMYSLYV